MPLSIPPTRVFWTEPTGRVRRYLRCHQSTDGMQRGVGDRADDPTLKDPTVCAGYCNAMRMLDEVDEEWADRGGTRCRRSYDAKDWAAESFPVTCERCGKTMTAPERQIFTDEILVVKTGERTGQTFVRRELPVGAMFDIEYYHDIPEWCGRDGIALMVVTPGGEWSPDGVANNCTKKDESPRVHRCWVRRGDPRAGYVHVDKDATVQETCAAGAGSIWQGKDGPRDWHGFCFRGYLCDAGDQGRVDALLGAATVPSPALPTVAPTVPSKPKSVPPPRRTAPAGAAKAFGRWRSSRRQ